MAYQPKVALLDLMKGSLPTASVGSCSQRGGTTVTSDGICGWAIQTQAPGPQGGDTGEGPKVLAYTTNSTNSFSGFFETLNAGQGFSRISYGSGLAVRFDLNGFPDGRHFVGFTGGRIGRDLCSDLSFMDLYDDGASHQYKYAGVGFDLARPQTTWQFASYGANGTHEWIDSGVAFMSGFPVIVVIDCADKATVKAEIRHGLTGVLQAAHTFPAGDAPGVNDSLQEGIANCTPNGIPAFAHQVGLYGAAVWRRG